LQERLGQGVVYTVAGSSGQITGRQLNHPAHYISLNELGPLIIDVNSNHLDAMFLGVNGAARDHFTVVKRASPIAAINKIPTGVSTTQIMVNWSDFAEENTGLSSIIPSSGSAFTDTGLLENTIYCLSH